MTIPPRPARPDPPPAPALDHEWPLGAPFAPTSRARHGSSGARALGIVVGMALVASAAFSIGELRGAHHTDQPGSSTGASSGLSGLSGLSLSGMSLSSLQKLESQVSQAAAAAQGTTGSGSSSDGVSAELSQLEQQLGISPSTPGSDQAAQLQAELNQINACISGSTATSSAC